MGTQISVLINRQNCLEGNFLEVRHEVSEVKFHLGVVSLKVQELADGQIELIEYVFLQVRCMLIREAGMGIRVEEAFRQIEKIRSSNFVILNMISFLATRRIMTNPSRGILSEEPQNVVASPSLNEGSNPSNLQNSENQLNRVNPQGTSFIKSLFYSVRDFVYSLAEIAVFLLSLGIFKRSFTLEESTSCVEKVVKVGRNFSKLVRFISVEFRQSIHFLSFHNELHININNTSNINHS